jgi:hypothetical protein
MKVTVSRFLLIYFRKDKSLAVSPFFVIKPAQLFIERWNRA